MILQHITLPSARTFQRRPASLSVKNCVSYRRQVFPSALKLCRKSTVKYPHVTGIMWPREGVLHQESLFICRVISPVMLLQESIIKASAMENRIPSSFDYFGVVCSNGSVHTGTVVLPFVGHVRNLYTHYTGVSWPFAKHSRRIRIHPYI